MRLEIESPCKVNLLLNILGKRADGFHELESVMHPVRCYDSLSLDRAGSGLQLTCNLPNLPTDSGNLVYRAAEAFLKNAGIKNEGIRIHLEKRIPLAAGLGGGSGNAAATLRGLNEMFGSPLSGPRLLQLAATLGSDVPFFLQTKPALATGRGEHIQSLDFFPAMKGAAFVLIHPGFGVSTAWAYEHLFRFPSALNGRPGRGQRLIALLETSDLKIAGDEFYNSLEAPVLEKYPLLELFQRHLRACGASATLMTGSGSTTFALARSQKDAEELVDKFKAKFGENYWTAVVTV